MLQNVLVCSEKLFHYLSTGRMQLAINAQGLNFKCVEVRADRRCDEAKAYLFDATGRMHIIEIRYAS
jgi:hypothetical protein